MPITIRQLNSADLSVICEHRERMFSESGRPPESLKPMTAAFASWLEPRLHDGRYFGWMAEEGGRIAGGLGMMIIDWPPHPNHPADDRRGYILNVFVEPNYRRRGIAKALMEHASDEASRLGLSYVVLHATRQGKVLYEMLGWTATSEMAIQLAAPAGPE